MFLLIFEDLKPPLDDCFDRLVIGWTNVQRFCVQSALYPFLQLFKEGNTFGDKNQANMIPDVSFHPLKDVVEDELFSNIS